MRKVVLIDDEKIVRNTMKRHLNWSANDYEIVGEASNGLDGLKIIKATLPDLAVIDLKMPKMDGIQLIESIRAESLDTQIIILTGFADKENLLKAFDLKVSHFVEKPISIQKLNRAIEEIGHQLNIKKTHTTQTLSEQFSLILSQIESDKLLSSQHDTTLWEIPFFNQKNLNLLAVYVRYDQDYDEDPISKQDLHDLILTTYPLEIHNSIYGSLSHNELFILLNISNPVSQEDLKYSAQKYKRFRMISSDKHPYILGLAAYQDDDQLNHVYIKAKKALEYSFYHPENDIFVYDNTDSKTISSTKTSLSILEAIQNNASPQALGYLRDLINLYRNHLNYLISQCKKDFVQLALDLYEFGSVTPSHAEISFPLDEVIQHIYDASNIRQIQDEIESLINQNLHGKNEIQHTNDYGQHIQLYIHENISNPSLDIQKIADHLLLSSSYICTVFKQNHDMTINQYLTKERMKLAKEILLTESVRIKDLAYRCGYRDPKYFSRKFNEYYGTSPKEYKERYSK